MVKSIALQYVKDRLLFLLFYCASIVCIVLFFYVTGPNDNEIAYPLCMAAFFLLVFLFVDWSKYYSFNKKIKQLFKEQYTVLEGATEEQKLVAAVIEKMNNDHAKEISQLEEQSKERYYFLSHWMHHLKTPVSVIELIVDKEQHDKLSDSDTWSRIKRENKRLHTSIEQGLTMIRMDRFENDFTVEAVDLLSSIRKLINERKSEFIYRQVYPVIEADKEDFRVLSDKKWNEVMIEQLISNALKYSNADKGSKHIYFRIEQNQQYTNLIIEDEGIGIPTYDMERIFEPFFTGENGRDFRISTGIGLYLCKKIIEKLGHEISIQSEKSIGTKVMIRYLTKV